jgi:rubredoxin
MMIPREYYYNNEQPAAGRPLLPPTGGKKRMRKREDNNSRPCPSNDGRALVWNKLQEYWMCPSCGFHTQQSHFDPVLEKIGAVSIVTADGFGGPSSPNNDNTANNVSKPMIRSLFKSRSGETLEDHRKTARVVGDRETEEWLKKQSPGTWLVDYREQ